MPKYGCSWKRGYKTGIRKRKLTKPFKIVPYYKYHITPIPTFFLFWVTLYPSMMTCASVRWSSLLYFSIFYSLLVQSIAYYCVMFGRYRSFLGTNALLCCDRYNWSLAELISNLKHIKNFSFKCWHFNGLSDIHKISAGSLSDLIAIRDWQLCFPPMFF